MGQKHSAYDSSKPIDWAQVAGDIRRYRKGQIAREELKERYPKLWIRDYDAEDGYREGVFFTIHRTCPFEYAVEIAFSTVPEPEDVCVAKCEMSVMYKEEWGQLRQAGNLQSICEAKKDVHFECLFENDELTLAYRLEEGEYWWDDDGGADWFTVDPDWWLRATINRKGEWVKPFAVGN